MISVPASGTGTATAALHGVSKSFSGRAVLDDVSLAFAPATRYVVRGPSGCGKSTLLNLLAGYLVPDTGRVDAANSTGYVMQDEMLFTAMTVRQNMWVRAAAIGMDDESFESLLTTCLQRTNVAPLVDSPMAQLSGGERQRVQLAGILLASVDLLLLDEPTSRLDVDNRRDIAAVVSDVFARCTVIVVTHDEDSPFAVGAVALRLTAGRLLHA